MKIRNIGPSQPPTVQKTEKTQKPDKAFSEVLGSDSTSKAAPTSGPTPTSRVQATGSVLKPEEVRELAQAYRAGQITKQDLTRRIADRIMEKLPGLSAAAKSRLVDRLTTLMEQDPSLVSRMDRIDRLANKS